NSIFSPGGVFPIRSDPTFQAMAAAAPDLLKALIFERAKPLLARRGGYGLPQAQREAELAKCERVIADIEAQEAEVTDIGARAARDLAAIEKKSRHNIYKVPGGGTVVDVGLPSDPKNKPVPLHTSPDAAELGRDTAA